MKEIYSWVPWFSELSAKIAENDKSFLIERAKQVNWAKENPALFNFGDENIDPFSFLFFLGSKNTKEQRKIVYPSVHEVFELQAGCPTPGVGDTFFFSFITPLFPVLFNNGTVFYPDRLWNFFRKSIKNPGSITNDEFSGVLQIPKVGVTKLTQCLTLASAGKFIHVPMAKYLHNTYPVFRELARKVMDKHDWPGYLELIEKLKSVFPGCELYEIARALYRLRKNFRGREVRCYSVTTSVLNGRGALWQDFSENNTVHVNDFRNREQLLGVLSEVEPGDIVLARDGIKQACGVGLVERNGYRETNDPTRDALHVIWINRSSVQATLSSSAQLENFIKDGPEMGTGVYAAFRGMEQYQQTFEVIKFFMKIIVKNGTIETSIPLNQILYGPPGTGKTYSTTRRCIEICDGNAEELDGDDLTERFQTLRDENRIEFVTFHQSYGYEEFVEGLRPETAPAQSGATEGDSTSTAGESAPHQPANTTGGFRLQPEPGVLKRIAERARQDSDNPYVLIIDEINRANVSKVLGELVTLLEEDKREGADNEVSVTLPYSGEAFTLPANLYILGTMNTADRSIALLDTALRRRFAFVEMPPRSELLRSVDGVDLPAVLTAINQRLEYLIDRDHLIGHAWFMACQSLDDINQTMANKIIPLLAEYFYDDWNKVRAVLGGGSEFISQEKLQSPPGLDGEDSGEARYRWTVNRPDYARAAYDNLINPATAQKSDT